MAERGNEKLTEWLDIKLDTLSSEERLRLIEEIFATLTPQELLTIRDLAEKQRQSKLVEAKAAVLEEMKGKLSALGLSLNDVVPTRRPRKNKPSVSVKYPTFKESGCTMRFLCPKRDFSRWGVKDGQKCPFKDSNVAAIMLTTPCRVSGDHSSLTLFAKILLPLVSLTLHVGWDTALFAGKYPMFT